jgi:hypothetical protein
MTTPCGARFADCRCLIAMDGHGTQGAGIHHCGVPGCGAMWVGADHVVRLPLQVSTPRRFGRPALRSVA